MATPTCDLNQQVALQKALAALRAAEYWHGQASSLPSESEGEQSLPVCAGLLMIAVRLEIVRIEQALLARGVTCDDRGGRIYPHTPRCLAAHARTAASITAGRTDGQNGNGMVKVPGCRCGDR